VAAAACCAGGGPALASPKFGLSEGALLDEEPPAFSETELLGAHAIRAHIQSSVSRFFAKFMFLAAAVGRTRRGQLDSLLAG
jgi:hypothetical protein